MTDCTWLEYPENEPENAIWYLALCDEDKVHPAKYLLPEKDWFVIGTTGKVIAFLAPPPYEKAQPQLALDTEDKR